MHEQTFQDVIPPQRRSIRDIPMPNGRRKIPHIPQTSQPEKEQPVRSGLPPRPRLRNRWRGNIIWIAAICAAIMVGSFVFITFSGSAVVTITPKRESISIETSVAAAYGDASTPGSISYETVSITREDSVAVASDGEEAVQEKASGVITIYNNYNTSTQELVATTRFQSEDGKIYRIRQGVTVPGQRVVNGETVPGTVDVTVYADEAGETYNLASGKLTIPGFAGGPRFNGFSAEVKTPIAGGFIGRKKIVSAHTLESSSKDLENRLAETLAQNIAGEVPQGYVLFPEGVFYTYGDIGQSDTSDDSVRLSRKGTVTAVIFDKAVLAKELGMRFVKAEDTDIAINNFSDLAVTFSNKSELAASPNIPTTISISGVAEFEWLFDAEALAEELAGKSKKALFSVLSQYPAVEKAEAKLSPIWKRAFPDNPGKIRIETQ